MFNRKSSYSDEVDAAALDDLSKKLATDLRRYVRTLAAHHIMTNEWFEMADALAHITNIALMEQRLPRKAGDTGTLWDRDELTVRFVLEEGKLNLCLRLMHEFYQFRTGASYEKIVQQKATQEMKVDPKLLESRLSSFEQSLGQLLACSFKSVESLQTVDLPLLVQHTTDVLKRCVGKQALPSGADFEKSQDAQVLSYFYSTMKFLEDLQEDRIMDLIDEYDLIIVTAEVLVKHSQSLPLKQIQQACQAISLVMETEAYKTKKTRFVKTPEHKVLICKLKGVGVGDMAAQFESRRQVQALVDNIERFEYEIPK